MFERGERNPDLSLLIILHETAEFCVLLKLLLTSIE